jgi:hypothetical protein
VNQLPVILRYVPGQANETILTVHASTPQGSVAARWNDYFVIANTAAQPNTLFFSPPGFSPLSGNTTPAWDTISYAESSDVVTAMALTRNALLVFHRGSVERLRGSVPPTTNNPSGDIWWEPMIGAGGCREPHTIKFWNDNVLWAESHGIYITDGTTIRDLTAQAGEGRNWRTTYQQQYRLCGGIYDDYYVCAMVDQPSQTFKKCFVVDLYARTITTLTNIPITSIVTTTGETEAVYGGTYDSRIIDLTKMWDAADSTVDTVDGNNVPVLPQLETAWYRISQDEMMKRIRNVFVSFDLTETTGHLKVYGCEQVQPRTGADWILLRDMRENDLIDQDGNPIAEPLHTYIRRRLPLGRESWGFSFKVETTGRIANLKLYDFAVEGPTVREASYA